MQNSSKPDFTSFYHRHIKCFTETPTELEKLRRNDPELHVNTHKSPTPLSVSPKHTLQKTRVSVSTPLSAQQCTTHAPSSSCAQRSLPQWGSSPRQIVQGIRHNLRRWIKDTGIHSQGKKEAKEQNVALGRSHPKRKIWQSGIGIPFTHKSRCSNRGGRAVESCRHLVCCFGYG